MKKSISVVFIIITGIALMAMINPRQPLPKSQTIQVENPVPEIALPDSVMKIVKWSCFNCHSSESGNLLAKCLLNFSRWDKFSPAKAERKKHAICYMVSKGKMPKKRFVKNNPYKALDKKDIDMLCNWSNAVASEAKEK